MKNIETLVEDIYDLFRDPIVFGKASEAVFIDALAKRMSEKAQQQVKAPNLRLSNLGIEPRKLWYSINKPELAEALPPEAKIKFLYGDILEEMLLWMAREAGHTVEREQEEVVLNGVKGHIDAIVDGWLIDVKSASSYSFNKFVDGTIFKDDPFGYIPQLDCYRTALGINGLRAAWIILDKSLGKLAFVECPNQNVDWNKYINKTRIMLAASIPPARDYKLVPEGSSGNMKLPVACSYCPWKQECYPGLRTFIYYKGPMHLAVVKKLPNVPEIK